LGVEHVPFVAQSPTQHESQRKGRNGGTESRYFFFLMRSLIAASFGPISFITMGVESFLFWALFWQAAAGALPPARIILVTSSLLGAIVNS
jgi:hypothetical protein